MEFIARKKIVLAVLSILIAGIAYRILPEGCPEPARRMSFIFIIAAFFWALEIIPLHATSFVIILLETLLLTKQGGAVGLQQHDYIIFLSAFSNPIIFLFLGGFILAAALDKYQLDELIAHRLINIFGENPFFIMSGFMITTAFFAFWMSATATTAMMLILIQPLLIQIKADNPFRKALVLSIPLGARIGGLCTPIGTPPNAIAVGILEEYGIHINFLSWMKIGVPLAFIILIASTLVLHWLFKSDQLKISFNLPPNQPLEKKGRHVFFISMGMVVLWLTSSLHHTPEAVVSLLGVTLFFAFNLLDRSDLKKIDWDILILMWGGLALGEGMEITGFTTWVIQTPLFSQSGPSLFIGLCLLAVGVSTFMSNTAAANLLLPLAISLPSDHPAIMVIAVALCCSFDIPLPISSPPNAMAFSTKVITVRDLLKAGIPVTIIAVSLIIFGLKFLSL
jgi:sodium-dependent dicarboxylate transporter 2/3/5